MEISDVRKRILETLDRAKRAAVERRASADQAASEYDAFLDRTAAPLFRQVASALRAEGHLFNVFMPGGSVRLSSDRAAEDYVELTFDTTGAHPHVLGRSSRSRGRRVIETERILGSGGPIRDVTEEEVLAFVLKELEPLLER